MLRAKWNSLFLQLDSIYTYYNPQNSLLNEQSCLLQIPTKLPQGFSALPSTAPVRRKATPGGEKKKTPPHNPIFPFPFCRCITVDFHHLNCQGNPIETLLLSVYLKIKREGCNGMESPAKVKLCKTWPRTGLQEVISSRCPPLVQAFQRAITFHANNSAPSDPKKKISFLLFPSPPPSAHEPPPPGQCAKRFISPSHIKISNGYKDLDSGPENILPLFDISQSGGGGGGALRAMKKKKCPRTPYFLGPELKNRKTRFPLSAFAENADFSFADISVSA